MMLGCNAVDVRYAYAGMLLPGKASHQSGTIHFACCSTSLVCFWRLHRW